MKQERIAARRLAQKIRQLRLERGWSQNELAEEAKIHKNYLGGIERAERNPSLSHLAKIADALSVTLPDLFDLCKVERK
ncbi:MAG: helix-turn-helix transcriptional regulator [Candidatus Obscuribacterales bacterium]|nr:helix-turn-helix transcriptional regulator [Candidatus Obscuribacterales bacterium]